MPAVIQPTKAPQLGTGLAYPMQLDTTKGRPLVVSGQDLVYASIQQILFTDIGERPFVTRNGIPYGTRIRRALFSPAEVAADIIVYETKRALDAWEPRITVTDVQVDKIDNGAGGVILVSTIRATWRNTNSPVIY